MHHRKLIDSFGYAFAGVKYAFRNNQNLWIHVAIAIVIIFASILFRINGFEMGILGVIILLVIASEMINTAIEEMVDLITQEHRREAKIAKDVAAGMVLVTALGSIIVGMLIFIPHILKLLK
ncbi:MAG TPA: diacylglycerol kinase family protein [Patescibacteria group bacterium]|nr:diacylglycerol kinase family protein [Patescibacteria group bacterium]